MEDKLKKDIFKIENIKLKSRLIVGTGKYKSMLECAKAITFSGAEIVTVAVRRVNITDKKKIIKTSLKKDDKMEIVHFIGGG